MFWKINKRGVGQIILFFLGGGGGENIPKKFTILINEAILKIRINQVIDSGIDSACGLVGYFCLDLISTKNIY